MFSPPMPGDVMVNFYINLSKLCLTVYQLHVLPSNTTKVSPPPVRAFIKSQWAARVTRRCAFCRWSLELQACRELRLAQPRSHVVSKAFVSFPFACRTYGSWGEDRGPPSLFESLLGSELNNNRFEVSHVHKVECVVPWLNDTLVFFTISLQLCQQLKDKVGVSAGEIHC